MPKNYDRYDVIMKVLEVIEADSAQEIGDIPEKQKKKKVLIVNKIKALIVFRPIINGDLDMHNGDTFEDINQSNVLGRKAIQNDVINDWSGIFEKAEASVDASTRTPEEKRLIKDQITTLKSEVHKEKPDAGVIQGTCAWLKQNADWLLPMLKEVVTVGLQKAAGF